MKIITHRCKGYGARENTLLALKRALASPVDEVEIDLQLSKDKHYVMVHNPWFRVKAKRVYVADMTLKQLKEHQQRARRQEFASLDEVLDAFERFGDGKIINLDIKREGKEKELVAAIKKRGLRKRVVIVSWIPKLLAEVKKLDKGIETAFSFTPIPKQLKRWKHEVKLPHPNKPIIYVNDLQAHNDAHHPCATHGHYLSEVPKKLAADHVYLVWALPVTQRIIDEAKKRKLKVCVVNVDTKFWAWRFKHAGVDAIITNKPRKFVY